MALYKIKGPFFPARYKAKIVQDEKYLIGLCYYIHLNPLKAGLVKSLDDWPFSNYPEFVGKRNGFNRKMQEQTIAEFRDGKFNVLVASSIGEEGLDIPAVDKVIFYEPVPSEIRSIQRRGRTGRFNEGDVLILIAKGTRDEKRQNLETRRKVHTGEHREGPQDCVQRTLQRPQVRA